MNLLHLLPDLGYTAAARQVSLVAPLLPRHGLTPHVATLGPAGPLAEPLRAAGVPVHELGPARRFDPRALLRLRRLVADLRPAAVHAWRLPALRAAVVTGRRLVATDADRGGRPTALDRRLLRRAASPAVPLAVPPPRPAAAPPGRPGIVCVGRLTPDCGARDAVWAFDVLRYAYPDLRLTVVGDGPDRGRLRAFARHLECGDRVRWEPARPDATAVLAAADVVWVPASDGGGRQVLREAQAAGRPVVAAATPALAALVADGTTGLLAPPGDPVGLVRQTRRLVDDPAFAAGLAAAARAATADGAPAAVAAAWAAAYARAA